jgi:hypothetical protein
MFFFKDAQTTGNYSNLHNILSPVNVKKIGVFKIIEKNELTVWSSSQVQ